MKNLIFKSSFHEKLKVLLIPMMLLTLGVGQMWAAMGFENSNNGILFSRTPLGGSKADYRVEHGRTNDTQDAGNVSALTMKEWYAKLYQNEDNLWGDGHMYYRIYLKDGSAPGFTTSNKSYYNWNSWNSGWRYPTFGNNSLSVNVLNGLASGIYYFEYYWDATATSTLYCSNNSNNFKIQFTIKPNALTSFSVSRSGYSAGSGTSSDPYIIARGGSLTLTASGSGGTSDSNSTIKYKYGSDDWTTSSKTISNITSTTKQSITVKGARRHNSQDLGSNESSVTIYYKAETTYSVSVTSGSPSSVYAGPNYTTPEITASNVTGYHFDHWSATSGITITDDDASTTTIKATKTGTVTANYEPNTYTITLDDNGSYQGDGSATATYNSGTLTNFSHASRTGWTPAGYYTGASTGSMVIDAAGNLVANVSTYTDASGNWIKAANTKLYARWKQTYSVTYYTNFPEGATTSGVAPTDANEYNSGASVTVLGVNTMSVTGYSFNGWNTDPSGSGTARAAGSTFSISGNTALYAQWTENMRNVTISVSPSGAGSLNKTSASVGVATTTTVTATAQPGYRFTGWTATNCSVASTSSASTTLSGNGTTGDATLVANFARTYAYLEGRMTVYDAARTSETHTASSKGGWDESSTRIEMEYDETNHRFYRHTYKTPAELKAQISSQDQWFSVKTGTVHNSFASGTVKAYHPSSNTNIATAGTKYSAPTTATTYNFKFTNTATDGYAIIYFDQSDVWYTLEHTLNYNGNGSTSGSAPSQAYYNHGANATAASNPFSKTNYTFGGWNTTQYITGTSYAVGSSITMNANTTLYAKWTRSITLNQEDATTQGSTSVTGTYNCSTLPAITNPSKDGYDFGGWYTETAGGGSFVINTSGQLQPSKYHWTDENSRFQRPTDKTTAPLYAKWTQTVTLNANTAHHGSGSNKTATVIYKKEALYSITHCTPATGYHRVGYYTDATGGTKVLNADGSFASSAVTDYITSSKWTKAGATTLYAQYEVNTYTIHYDPNGEATGSMDDQAATWGNYPTLTSNGFTREGYTFAGWATSPTGAVVYSNGQTLSTNLTNDNNATVTLYAKWTGKTYTVTFNARGGSGLTPTSKKVTMGSAYGALATVTPPAGYVFDGWYTSAGGGTKVESSTLVATPSDHTLYAHYAEKAQVYFKNTFGWSKVYVVYDANWDGSQGTGSEGKIYREMTKVAGTSDVYYDNIPDEYITSWRWNIAFNNTYQYNYHAFTKGEAVFRYDFDRNATMFVPTSNTGTSADGNYTKNGVQYRSTGYPGESSGPKYTSGYWRTYNNTYSGYTMTYQKNGGSWSGGHKMESAKVGDNVFCFTVNMEANSQYNFSFYKNYNLNNKSIQFCYNPSTQINSSNCTNLQLDCNPNNSYMQTTVAGEYTFQLEMKADGHMYLSVIYPLAVGDFRVRYNYTKGSAKTYYSEIIKGRANGKDTISIFIHSKDSASSRSLTVEKCTGISSGTPTWDTSYLTVTSKLPAATTAGGKTSGVYDFIITQNGSKEIILDNFSYWKQYTGNYYIRTDVSDGGWDLYKYRTDNIMTLSEYSLTQTLSPPYSHYYCRFIGSAGADITYCIATDYSPNISGTMIGDETIGGVGNRTLPATANVRFTWNMETNALRRAYLKNAQNENERFLVLHGKADDNIFNNDASGTAIAADPGRSLAKNELLFEDLGNWIYQVELKAKPNAAVSLIAKYNNADRYLIGSTSSWMTIMGGSGSAKYEILAVYDFKTNRLMTVWKPSGDITQTLSDVDVLLIRHAQEAGQAITFNGGSLTTKKVYGALEFRYNELVGHVTNWTSSSRPLLKFFISFPFDVNVSDIFGLNSAYGDAYEIQMYDGAERARKGFFRGDGTTTFWKTLQPGDVMKANEGYCVIMDNDYLNNDIGHVWDNKVAGSSVYLYFPSTGPVGSIASSSKTIAIPERTCSIDRPFVSKQAGGRTVSHQNTDSHWNMMGIPIFANTTDGTLGGAFVTSGQDGDGTFKYFYAWNSSNNQFAINTASGYTFNSMHGYMVQYYGNVTFTGAHTNIPASVARRAPEENHQIELQVLNSDEEVINRAYVELRENACDTFALNEDVYMWTTNEAVDIYTFAGNYDVSANVLSLNDQTIQVGVEVRKAGKYTFSMPSNFNGTATLIDTFTGTRTNLAVSDYEVQLEKGIDTERFLLELYIEKVTTSLENNGGNNMLKDGGVHKFIKDNQLYILKNGAIYDARGARIQ